MRHTLYYSMPRGRSAAFVAARATSGPAAPGNSGPGSAAPGKRSPGSSRRERVRRRAAQISETLGLLEADAPLASYDLRLPGATAEPITSSSSSASSVDIEASFFDYAGAASSSSSESSDSSDSEDERPASHTLTARGVATISVCQGKACRKRGSDRVEAALHSSTAGLSGVEVQGCKCLGQCKRGPAVQVDMPDGQQVVYVGVAGAESAVQLAAVVLPSLT